MPKRSLRPFTLRDTWRPKTAGSLQEIRAIFLRRILFSVLLISVVIGFSILLFRPFYHPNTRLYYFTGGDYSAPYTSPVKFYREDAIKFLSSDGYFDQEEATNNFREWTTPNEAYAAIDSLAKSQWRHQDLPIIYLSGHSTIVDGRPCFHTQNLHFDAPSESAVFFEEIFNKLILLPVDRVLLFLDLDLNQPTERDTLETPFDDTLVNLLKRDTYAKIWVISSHSLKQRSNISSVHNSSAFLSVLVDAFQGKDTVQKNSIHFAELVQYLTSKTENLVKSESGERTIQTPFFLGDPKRIAKSGNWTVASFDDGNWREKLTLGTDKVKELTTSVAVDENPDQQKKNKQVAWLSKLASDKSEAIKGKLIDEVTDSLYVLPTFISEPIKERMGVVPSLEDDKPTTKSEDAQTKLPDGPDLKALPTALADLSQLLQLVHQYCEYVETNPSSKFRPLETIPVAWAYTSSRIESIEKRLRYGTIADQEAIKVELVSLIVAMHQLAIGEAPKLEGKLEAWREQWPVTLGVEYPLISLSNLERSAVHVSHNMAFSKLANAFDLALDQPTSDALKELITQPTSSVEESNAKESSLEIFYAKRLLQASNIDWALASRTLKILRSIDQLLCDESSTNNDVYTHLESAFSEWLHGYRICDDQILNDWKQTSIDRFSSAEEFVAQSREMASQLTEAKNISNRTNQQIEQWIAQYKNAALSIPDKIAAAGILDQLLSQHIELTEKLIEFETVKVSEIRQTLNPLKAQISALNAYWRDYAIGIENSELSNNANEIWLINELLELNYYNGPERGRLIKRWLDWTTNPQKGLQSQSIVSTFPIGNRSNPFEPLERRFSEWKASLQVVLSNWSDRLTKRELRSQEFAIRLERTYSSDQINPKQLLELISRSNSVDRLTGRSKLYRTGTKDSTQEERNFYLMADSLLRESIVSLSSSAQVHPIVPSPVTIESTPVLSLESETHDTIKLTLRNRSSTVQEVWLLADYDAEILHFETEMGEVLYGLSLIDKRLNNALQGRTQLLAAELAIAEEATSTNIKNIEQQIDHLKRSLQYPVNPMVDEVPPSVVLPPNSTKEISVLIGRFNKLADAKKIAWKSVTRDHYTRAETIVKLPTSTPVEIVANASDAATRPIADGLQIELFPNRKTNVRFGLRSLAAEDGNYQVQLWIPERELNFVLPPGELSSNANINLKGNLPNMLLWQSIPKFQLAGDKKTQWLTPVNPNGQDDSKSGSNGAAPSTSPNKSSDTGSNSEDDSKAASSPTLQFSVSNGIVAEITNTDTNRSIWRKIEIRTRHPRSYIDIRCSYDSEAGVAAVSVRARDNSLLPTSGIPVMARVRETLPKGTEAKLSGTLLPNSELKLYTHVPLSTLRTLTMELDVEGFPRAFVATIPCWKTSTNIPADIEHPYLTFQDVLSGVSLRPGSTLENITLLVDSMEVSFQTASDKIEIGWDLNQDRELDSEQPIVFRSDRSQKISASAYSFPGAAFRSEVGNMQIQLPVPVGVNRRANLLAKLTAGGQISWSEPVELIIDGESPTILGVDISPSSRVPTGTDLNIQVAAEDGNLSGVATVQAAIDVVGVQKWSEVKSPISGKRMLDGGWKIDVPTGEITEGRVTLVIAATDRAGNISQIHRSVIDIISAEEWALIQANRQREIHGLITHNDQMVSNAKVTIYKENGDILTTIEADNRGLFKFPAVPAGKYKIAAVAVIKNRPRRAEDDVTVKADSDEPILKELQLK